MMTKKETRDSFVAASNRVAVANACKIRVPEPILEALGLPDKG